MSLMLFGAKSSSCKALYIKNKNDSLFASKYPESVNSLIDNCYIGDFFKSCKSLKVATDRIKLTKEINSHPNWEMHGWASNCAN